MVPEEDIAVSPYLSRRELIQAAGSAALASAAGKASTIPGPRAEEKRHSQDLPSGRLGRIVARRKYRRGRRTENKAAWVSTM